MGSPSLGTARRSSGLGRAGAGDAWRSDRALRRAMVEGQTEQAERAGRAGANRGTGSAGPARVTGSIWPHLENAILDQVLAHRTTLVFVNSRGACERLTARLNETYAARSGTGLGAQPESQLLPRSESREPVHRES